MTYVLDSILDSTLCLLINTIKNVSCRKILSIVFIVNNHLIITINHATIKINVWLLFIKAIAYRSIINYEHYDF